MSEPTANELHGVTTPREVNKLDNAQTYKLTAELDRNRAEYSALTIGEATKRLRTALGFVITDYNVKGAARILGLRFAAEPRKAPSPPLTIRAELDSIRAELSAAVAEFREKRDGGPNSADVDAIVTSVTATTDAISARLDKVFAELSARMDALTRRVDTLSTIETVKESRNRSLLGGIETRK